jgi:hypothetical protein
MLTSGHPRAAFVDRIARPSADSGSPRSVPPEESGWEPHQLAGGFDRGGEFAVLALKFRGLAGAPWSYATYRGS